jgi:hypothetical protein
MADLTPAKKFAALDFNEAVETVRAATAARKPVAPALKAEAARNAHAAGFVTRAEPVKVDGRSLRKTGRTAQLNIRVKPAMRDRFVSQAAEYDSAEAYLEYLMDLAAANSP